MRKNLTRTPKELASWAPYLLALSSVFVVGSLTWETRPFVGDDLEVYAAMERGEYLNKWSDILRDTSLDKWRPINNAYLFLTINLFGNSYPSFWILNTVLALVLGIVVIRFFHQLGLTHLYRCFSATKEMIILIRTRKIWLEISWSRAKSNLRFRHQERKPAPNLIVLGNNVSIL